MRSADYIPLAAASSHWSDPQAPEATRNWPYMCFSICFAKWLSVITTLTHNSQVTSPTSRYCFGQTHYQRVFASRYSQRVLVSRGYHTRKLYCILSWRQTKFDQSWKWSIKLYIRIWDLFWSLSVVIRNKFSSEFHEKLKASWDYSSHHCDLNYLTKENLKSHTLQNTSQS